MLSPLSWTLPTRAATVADCLASVVLAVGYAVLVVRAVAATRRASLLAWAAPVGRTAFTNYVVQTVVLGLLFHGHGHGHGHGLGLMGRIGIAAGLGVAAAIYAAQVFASRLQLRGHRFGPLEWLWRMLTHGERQPWRWGR